MIQEKDEKTVTKKSLSVVTKKKPTIKQFNDMLFAFKITRYVKSNSIVFVKNNKTLAIGAGQMSRIDSTNIAFNKSKKERISLKGSVMASEAFFPFRDGIDKAASSGIAAIIQPGGSIKDDEVIAAANENNIAMVFTGMRHFRH